MKIPKSHLNRFKKAFVHWQKALGLTCYRMVLEQKDLSGDYAQLDVNEEGMVGVAYLCDSVQLGVNGRAYSSPEDHAKHEAIHLLSHRLVWLAQRRYATEDEINREWEALVRRLEKVLK